MTLAELITTFGFTVYAPPADGRLEVGHGYASDMLSDVIANAVRDDIWVTMQIHVNIVAVAALKDIAAIVIVSDRKPAADTIDAAMQKGVCLLGTALTAFGTCGRLYAAGIGDGKAETR